MNGKTLRKVSTPLGEISYELERKRIKRLNLHIKRDRTVYLSIPYGTSYAYADKFVTDSAEFVFSSIAKIAQKTALDTEHTFFLGKRLDIETVPSEKPGGELSPVKDSVLILFMPLRTQAESEEEYGCLFKKSLELWQLKQARLILPEALSLAHKRFDLAGLKVPYPALSVRSMTSRWGSCAAFKKKVTLNSKLVEKPFICIEQVACHELAHFLVQNHSADFYRVLDRVMPEHREVSAVLKKG